VLPAPAGMVRARPRHERQQVVLLRPRGWSQVRRLERRHPAVLPAPAGMVPRPSSSAGRPQRATRVRGDGPKAILGPMGGYECSPRPRGWSRACGGARLAGQALPAPAGMVPIATNQVRDAGSAPRACGDGPSATSGSSYVTVCSPRPRGWFRLPRKAFVQAAVFPPAGMVPGTVRPARRACRAPRARGDGPSPTRRSAAAWECSPRPAGMVPTTGTRAPSTPSAPRARGDGPQFQLTNVGNELCPLHPLGDGPNAAWRSVREVRRSPRARGDGPSIALAHMAITMCSPRPRGRGVLAVGRGAVGAVGPLTGCVLVSSPGAVSAGCPRS
jgi:hypothetical protein